jgi:hypothetical protein
LPVVGKGENLIPGAKWSENNKYSFALPNKYSQKSKVGCLVNFCI